VQNPIALKENLIKLTNIQTKKQIINLECLTSKPKTRILSRELLGSNAKNPRKRPFPRFNTKPALPRKVTN
jgi:hypothetical protein